MSLETYLGELGGSTPIIEKSMKMLKLAGSICPEKIEDFVVSEYAKKDGTHVFDALWFFSHKYCLESKRFVSDEYNLDLACIFRNLDRVEITFVHYDPFEPNKTTADSKLSVIGQCGSWILDIKATKSNCSKLFSIFMKYLKPNIVEIIERDE